MDNQSTKKYVFNAICGFVVLIPVFLLNNYLVVLYALPQSLLPLGIVLFFSLLLIYRSWSKTSKAERIGFILIVFGIASTLCGVIIDWKYIQWLNGAGLLKFAPFLPFIIYIILVQEGVDSEST